MDPMSIIRDPNLARHRIFIGNVPESCTREDLEGHFSSYGKILAVLIQKNFAFIQFQSEAIANQAASGTSMTMFKGNKITVRNAGAGKQKQLQKIQQQQQVSPQTSRAGGGGVGVGGYVNAAPPAPALSPFRLNTNPDYNDCEIIVVDKSLTEYAEHIEDRLKRLNLLVDLLFPNDDVPIGKVLANISSRGCLYAILVKVQNQEHRSITVNILYGQPAEHRNMPVEDAIELIAVDFEKKVQEEKTRRALAAGIPSKPIHQIIQTSHVSMAPPLKERHPEGIQILLNLLAENLPLTVLQYDRLIKYLRERRELQIKAELGDAADDIVEPLPITKPLNMDPDPEIEVQKKLYNILNKPAVTNNQSELIYPNLQTLQQDKATIELLKDVRVQKALDSLMNTNLVDQCQDYYKF